MLLVVAEIMFRMISQIFKGIEIFVFNFPSDAFSFDKHFDIRLINGDVGYLSAIKGDLIISNDGIFEKIYVVGCLGSV